MWHLTRILYDASCVHAAFCFGDKAEHVENAATISVTTGRIERYDVDRRRSRWLLDLRASLAERGCSAPEKEPSRSGHNPATSQRLLVKEKGDDNPAPRPAGPAWPDIDLARPQHDLLERMIAHD